MISSSGTAPQSSPCLQPQATNTTGQCGSWTVQYKQSNCGDRGMEIVKINPAQSSSGYSKADIVKDSIFSRFVECVDAASRVKDKYDELVFKCRKAVGLPSSYLYCQRKFNKLFDSGRDTKLMRCGTEEKGFSLKNVLLGQEYYPNYFIYSTISEAFDANGKMDIDGTVPWCGELALFYAKGLYGPGKKALAQCQSIDELQELMRLHGVDAWNWQKNRSDNPKETHAFHSSDFAKAISALVHQYWDMPCGERKVFLLETEQVKHFRSHAMVIMLEKKTDGVMVLRHYDPNWTNSCQKVILNNPDHADFLDLSDLYRDKDVEHFFKHGVAKLTSLETVRDNHEADYYWYSSDNNGQAGLRLSVKGGLWFRCQSLPDTQERSDYDQRRGILEDDVVRMITEEVLVGNKSETEKEAIIEYFIRYMGSDAFNEKISSQFLQSNLSAEFKLRSLRSCRFQNYRDLLPIVPHRPEDLLGLGPEERVAAFTLAVTNGDRELAEFAVIAELSDDTKSEEDKVEVIGRFKLITKKDRRLKQKIVHYLLQSNLSAGSKLKYLEELGSKELVAAYKISVVNNDPELAEGAVTALLSDDSKPEVEKVALLMGANTDPRDMDKEFQRRLLPVILTSNLSLRFKLEYFEYFFEEYQDYFKGFRDDVSESLCRESPPTDLADGLRLALYLNDVKLAGNILDMSLSNDEYSEEEKMMILDITKTLPIPWGIVQENVDVVKCYLSGILESNLSDANKVKLSRMNKYESRSIIYQALLTIRADVAHHLVGVVVNSKLSPALKEKIVDPNACLGIVASFEGGVYDKQVQEMKEMLGQLIMENKNAGEKEVLDDRVC